MFALRLGATSPGARLTFGDAGVEKEALTGEYIERGRFEPWEDVSTNNVRGARALSLYKEVADASFYPRSFLDLAV